MIGCRRLYGIAIEIEALGEYDGRHGYQFVLAPAFALLDNGKNTRIW